MFKLGDIVYYEEWGRYRDIEGVIRDIDTAPGSLGIEVTNISEFYNHNLSGQLNNFKGLYIPRDRTTLLNRIIPYTQFQTGDTEEDI